MHPWDGETTFNYTGPKPPYEQLEVEQKYSWLKAPRWNETAVEVGPLARVLAMYATGNKPDQGSGERGAEDAQGAPSLPLFSTLGRTAARGHRNQDLRRLLCACYYNDLIAEIKAGNTDTFNGEKWEPRTWPPDAKGFGYMEAPRGALGHWIVIKNGKIDNYQMVVPTTWNGSPRDHKGQPGAYEACAGRHTAGQARMAAGDPAHHPLVRSLYGLRHPYG